MSTKDSGMRAELLFTTDTLLREIADKRLTRRDVAQTYRLAMQSSERTDWARVNQAIIERWSVSALRWIKEQAWSGKAFGAPSVPHGAKAGAA